MADLLVFSPMAAVFMTACVLAVAIPLWLTRRKERAAGTARRPRLSAACLGRYDFWVVFAITLGGVFFFQQSLELTGVSSYFPQAVYASIIGLGVFIMGMQAFQTAPMGRALPSRGALGSIGIYLGIMALAYLLIEPLGFYTALFLGTGAMTAYGVFGLTDRKRDWRGLAFVLGYTLLLTSVEYGCFRLLMGVQTPTGFLI